jgi:putative Holliday junction resolvase
LKLLALDLGDRRIGLAVAHDSSGQAFPAGHLLRTKLSQDLQAVLNAAKERGAEGIVVGIPYALDGSVSRQAKLAQGFVRALNKETALPVFQVDESFTSFEAEGLLREAGVEPSRNKGSVDEAAAVLILQRFLEQQADGSDINT